MALIIALAALTGCAKDGYLPGTRVLTVATSGDVVLVGFSQSFGATGNFELTSIHGQPMACRGTFRYAAPPRGGARFNCTNGETGSVRIEAGRGWSGEGFGQSTRGPVRILYGYSLEEINARMTFPEGKVLVRDEKGIRLVSEDEL
ncbi:MAG TPA: hypothetical protein VF190_07620 [Rhodothermales bacterium]